MFNLFSKHYKIKCPDGSVRLIYKNVDDAFPMSLANNKWSANANGKDSVGNTGSIAAEASATVKEMLLVFDNVNKNIMLDYRSAYIYLQASPCTNMEEYHREERDIRRRIERAKRFEEVVKIFQISIQSCPERALEVCESFKAIFSDYSKECASMNIAMTEEIKKSQKVMIELNEMDGASNG